MKYQITEEDMNKFWQVVNSVDGTYVKAAQALMNHLQRKKVIAEV